MANEVGIGLLGLGTVGSGIAQVLSEQAFRIATETGVFPEIKAVGIRDLNKKRDVLLPCMTTDLTTVVDDPEVDIVIEVMGGLDPAEHLIRRALASGKPVITANKELLAKRWTNLHEFGGVLRYEASVMAAVPIIQVLKRLAATQPITRIEGILNGTTNFILTEMVSENKSFEEMLIEAQSLGYAEADPSSDVEGWDAAYKLAILSNLATGDAHPIKEIAVEGIQGVDPGMLELARDRGKVVKLIARFENGQLSVRPELIALEHPLAQVDGTLNAVTLTGPYFDTLTMVGRGAGGLATTSAIVSDLVDILFEQFQDRPV